MSFPARVHLGSAGRISSVEGGLLGAGIGGVQEQELGRERLRAVEHGAGHRSTDLLVWFFAEDPLSDAHAARRTGTTRSYEQNRSPPRSPLRTSNPVW